MASRRRSKVGPRDLCARTYPDDGVDPREAFSRIDSSEKKADHKVRQLCKQAAQAIQAALAGGCNDPLLQDLEVICVDPARHGSRLVVTLQLSAEADAVTEKEVLDRIRRVSGFLRSEVTETITRRCAPELSFRVIPRGEVGT